MNFIVIQKQVYQKEIIKKMIWNKICCIFVEIKHFIMKTRTELLGGGTWT